jgi:hypothetical protein
LGRAQGWGRKKVPYGGTSRREEASECRAHGTDKESPLRVRDASVVARWKDQGRRRVEGLGRSEGAVGFERIIEVAWDGMDVRITCGGFRWMTGSSGGRGQSESQC